MRDAHPTHLLAALVVSTLIVILSVACAGRGPVIDATGSPPQDVGGTISGIVRAAPSSPLSGRIVTATNLATGARFEASTAVNGGYTMKVPIGKYKLDVELRDGETVGDGPTDVQIHASDLDAGRNFVITVREMDLEISRPR